MLTGMKGPDLVVLSLCQAHCSLRELSLFPVFPLAALSLFPSSVCNSLLVVSFYSAISGCSLVGFDTKDVVFWYDC